MPEVQEEMRRVLAAHGPPETTRTSRRRRGRRASTGRRRVPERLGQRPGRWCPWPPRPRPRPPGAPAVAVWTAGSSLLLPGSAACRSTDEPNPGRGPVPARSSRAGTASTLTWIPGRSRPRRGGARRRPPRRRLARRWRHARSPSGTSAPSIRTIRRLLALTHAGWANAARLCGLRRLSTTVRYPMGGPQGHRRGASASTHPLGPPRRRR